MSINVLIIWLVITSNVIKSNRLLLINYQQITDLYMNYWFLLENYKNRMNTTSKLDVNLYNYRKQRKFAEQLNTVYSNLIFEIN